jgi:hypothetical protein
MVLWNHQTILEPESVFLIHAKIVDFRVTFSQPPLNVCDSRIDALSYNDFPSQHRGEGHIILSHDRDIRTLDSSLEILTVGRWLQ